MTQATSVRERLAAKARRTCTVPVQVSDPGPARAAHDDAQRRVLALTLAVAEHGDDEQRAAALAEANTALDVARAALDEHFVHVEFQALADDEYEAIVARFSDDEGALDRRAATPLLAAACAVDESLRDPDWWAEQLARPEWSTGEALALHVELLNLNFRAPASLGKG
jgi:hypothetical protein